jgi:hypothetical protein
MSIPLKVAERISKNLSKFQSILKMAKDKDLNESDTVQIITDMLADIFGYNKYLEITSELAVRGTYCDLAIKLNEKIQFLIECKSVGTTLKDNHLRQVVDYGAKQGISWVILTNGINWEIHKIKFDKPISADLVYSLDMLEISGKKEDVQEKLFILCKEGVSKDIREDFYEKVQSLNRFVIGAFILSEPVLSSIRKELRKFSEGLKIENEEIEKIIRTEILKREITDGEEATKNLSKVRRYFSKQSKIKDAKICNEENAQVIEQPAEVKAEIETNSNECK